MKVVDRFDPIYFTEPSVRGYRADKRLLKSGGDDAGEDMRRQEEERQRATLRSMNEINRIYGGPITEMYYYDPAAEAQEKLLKAGKISPAQALSGGDNRYSTATPAPSGEWRTRATAQAPGQFGDDYFSSIADAYMKFQSPLLQEQAAEARRKLPFSFASTDNSDYQRMQGELEADIGRQGVMLREQGLDFANKQRAEVEGTRGDLVGMANSGTDASAVAAMAASRAQALTAPPTFVPLSDMFEKYTAVGANNMVAAAQKREAQPQELLFNNSRKAQRIIS